tara:strand:- start:48933 stop:49049 length:117 start_codon:yes stop_codon:yes gene_type:complete
MGNPLDEYIDNDNFDDQEGIETLQRILDKIEKKEKENK